MSLPRPKGEYRNAQHEGTPVTGLSAQAVRDSVRDLPPLPEVVMELIQSLGNEALGAEQLAQRIARDPALAAKTLRLANSSLYGMSRRVTSIGEATAILGLRNLRSVATAAGLVGSFAPSHCAGFEFKAFWHHTIGTALCARALAGAQGLDEEEAFTLGLLHDIGRLALASSFPEATARAMAHQRDSDGPTLESERAVLGTDHCAVGGMIAEHWCFAPAIVDAIVSHHEPAPSACASLADVVHVADNIAHALDLSKLDNDIVPPLSMPAWIRLRLDEGQCRAVFQQAEAQHEAVCAALSI
jgi:putative nucleotidyltransferase with HDIG domain